MAKKAKKAAKKVAKKAAKPAASKSARKAAKRPAAKKSSAPFIALHPSIDKGFAKTAGKNFSGGTLSCNCATDTVTVAIHSQSAHNHACGCTKCWKPDGAILSVVAVVPSDKVEVTDQLPTS